MSSCPIYTVKHLSFEHSDKTAWRDMIVVVVDVSEALLHVHSLESPQAQQMFSLVTLSAVRLYGWHRADFITPCLARGKQTGSQGQSTLSFIISTLAVCELSILSEPLQCSPQNTLKNCWPTGWDLHETWSSNMKAKKVFFSFERHILVKGRQVFIRGLSRQESRHSDSLKIEQKTYTERVPTCQRVEE